MISANGRRSAGFSLPPVFPDGEFDIPLIRSVVSRAEFLGYESLWTQEQIIGRSQSLEPLALLSYVASITQRVRLGVSVIVLPHRNPLQLAKLLSTIDILSHGRLTVGVGLGNGINEAFGISSERRVRRFTDVLQSMMALWTSKEASYEGELIRFTNVFQEPKPIQKPHPPLWFGARSSKALERAVKYADGWMGAGSSTPKDFRRQLGEINRMLEKSGRDPATFTISKRLYVAIDDDEARAETRLCDWFSHNYGNAQLGNKVSVWGPAERVYEIIDEFLDLGIQHILLNPVFDYDEHLEALARYGNPDIDND